MRVTKYFNDILIEVELLISMIYDFFNWFTINILQSINVSLRK